MSVELPPPLTAAIDVQADGFHITVFRGHLLVGQCVCPADEDDATPFPPRLPIPPFDEHAYVQVSECFGWTSEEAWRFFAWLYQQHGLPEPSRRSGFLPPYWPEDHGV